MELISKGAGGVTGGGTTIGGVVVPALFFLQQKKAKMQMVRTVSFINMFLCFGKITINL